MSMDEYLDKQEQSFMKLYDKGGNVDLMDEAELNYESVLAAEIVKQKEIHGSTLAKEIAKGQESVQAMKRIFNEKARLVAAGKQKINWLQNKYEAEKKKIDFESKIVR